MKYLFKSNLLVILSSLIFPLAYMLISFNELNKDCILFMMIVIEEALIFKTAFDYSNYDHDYKYYVHRLPKWAFYLCSIILNILAIVSMVMLSSSFKWFIIISIIMANGYHLLFKKNYYTLSLFATACFVPILVVGYNVMFFAVGGGLILFSVGLAYYLYHKPTKVYTYDNY